MIDNVHFSEFNTSYYPAKVPQTNVFRELPQDSFVKSEVQNQPSKKSSKLPTIIAIGTAAAIVGLAIINRKNITKFIKELELKNIAKKLDAKFPQDAMYRSRLASHLGLTDKELYKVSSIAGGEEMKSAVAEFMRAPEVYIPKVTRTAADGVREFVDDTAIAEKTFGANFHNHTILSDGTMSVKEFLQKSAKYADSRFEKFKKPFYVAITDHDTVEGCKEAVRIVSENPQQYKNLRLVLGTEHTVLYHAPECLAQDGQIHVLSYGINPFSPQFKHILNNRIEANKQNIRNAISFVNSKFQSTLTHFGVKYDIDDMSKISPAITTGLKNSTFYMKDYLQFKLIHAKAISKNPELISSLQSIGISPKDFDFAKPISLIPKNLDYSKGQKYYEYYYEALQNQVLNAVKEKHPTTCADGIHRLFPPLDKDFRGLLDTLEDVALNPESKGYVPPVRLLDFETAISKLSALEDGVIGIAHPGVIFPENVIKKPQELPKMYDKLYETFKKKGREKALFVEDFYQSYYKDTDKSLLDALKRVSTKHGLLKTGGIDTHGTDIFTL